MNRYKCEKKKFFFAKKIFQGGAGSPCQKKIFPAFGRKNFFWDTPGYTWIHLAIARCCRIHLKGLKSVPGCGFWAQVYPEVFRAGVIAKKKFQGGVGYAWHNPTCTYARNFNEYQNGTSQLAQNNRSGTKAQHRLRVTSGQIAEP